MTLSEFVAETRTTLFQAISDGRPPPIGEFEHALLKEGLAKGKPFVGTTRFEPGHIFFEFIFPDPNGAPILLPVRVIAPERIVFMPVPEWVVAQIWEGEVMGSHRFESEARNLLASFESELASGPNAAHFERVPQIGRS